MWETIVTLAIVLIAAIGVGVALYRAARGKSGCAGCRGCAEADDVKTCDRVVE